MTDPSILSEQAIIKQRLSGIEGRLADYDAKWAKQAPWNTLVDQQIAALGAHAPPIIGGGGTGCACGCGGLCGGRCGNPNCTCGRTPFNAHDFILYDSPFY